MGLIDSIVGGALSFRADISGTPAPWDDYWYNPLGTSSASGMRISAETAKNLAVVQACVGIIGRTMAMMPCKIYTDIAGGRGKKTVPHHPVYDLLLKQPNDRQTAFEWFQQMQGWYELHGNAYSEIVPGKRGAVDQLLPMHPDRVKVERLTNGSLRYVYSDPLTSQARTLVQEEVFHLRNWSDDGAIGQSTIAMGKDVFGVALAQQDAFARFLKNDSRPGIALTGTNFKTTEDEKRFRESWQASQTGANRGKAAILPANVDLKTFGVTPKDAMLLDSRKFSRIEICSMFGVPPHKIGETEKTATYASVEQFNIMFCVDCILPRCVNWEQTIQRDLLLSSAYYPKFSMAALMRGDNATRAAYYTALFNIGMLNQDEAREMEDLNPSDSGGAQTYFRGANTVPLEQTRAAPAPMSPDNEDPEETDDADPNTDESDGDEQQAALQRLRLMAMAGAERCVRKESAVLKRLFSSGATDLQVREALLDHAEFVSQVMQIDRVAANLYMATHAEKLCGQDDPGRDQARIRIEIFAPRELVDLAMKGSQ